MSLRLSAHFALAATLTFGGEPALAAPIGSPEIEIYLYAMPPGNTARPGLLQTFAGEADAQDGEVFRSFILGTSDSGRNQGAAGFATVDGVTFWASVDTPSNFRKPNTWVGGSSEVFVTQSFTKDSPDATLNFTYTWARAVVGVHPEFGPGCPLGDRFCQSAELISTVNLYDADSLVWSRLDSATAASTNDPRGFSAFTVGDFPWLISEDVSQFTGTGGLGIDVRLDGPVTRAIDLSGIDLNEEFTVQYQLFVSAYDRGSNLGLRRTAFVYGQDPTSGGTGVSFDFTGLTPTNRPYIPAAVPLPATWMLMAGGLAMLSRWSRRFRTVT